MSRRLVQLRAIQKQGFELFSKKNADYGDAFATYGAVGVLVRIGDKLQRLSSIEKNKVVLVDDESLRDTLIDLHNYSAMAIMCLDDDAHDNKNLSVDNTNVSNCYDDNNVTRVNANTVIHLGSNSERSDR